MTLRLVLATGNPGKIREFRRLFHKLHPEASWELPDARQEGLNDADETGLTFVENARIKALAAAKQCGKVCLGEDSGLEVDFLSGAPGIKSHRFSSSGLDQDNNELLLRKLEGVRPEQRTARYRCAVAVAGPQGILLEAEGTVEGAILHISRGAGGFGYDPLFWCPELGKTLAQASDEEKDRVSHRRRALEGIVLSLVDLLCEPAASAAEKLVFIERE